MVLLDFDPDKYHLPAEEDERISQEKAIPSSFASAASVKKLNAETQKTLEETDDGVGLIECKDIEDLFNKIGL